MTPFAILLLLALFWLILFVLILWSLLTPRRWVADTAARATATRTTADMAEADAAATPRDRTVKGAGDGGAGGSRRGGRRTRRAHVRTFKRFSNLPTEPPPGAAETPPQEAELTDRRAPGSSPRGAQPSEPDAPTARPTDRPTDKGAPERPQPDDEAFERFWRSRDDLEF